MFTFLAVFSRFHHNAFVSGKKQARFVKFIAESTERL
ncbi:hypothetical protein BACCAP_01372 [Pseudoflavonifractor capillosus ATCC 29799]|uniref:Uncharacterized protein n=1 Tax=Pseudoflavonifractor capillosus ATCC 29799 TaxID=411467 RepID=A6NT43_9FIRM|nr:hypothetical protein BACCAP_01372 [Pseudoflavonifractor capillosus ATCC 29799]